MTGTPVFDAARGVLARIAADLSPPCSVPDEPDMRAARASRKAGG